MIKWLFEKIVGWPWCRHEWETIAKVRIFDPSISMETPTHRDYHLRCKKCGDMRKRRL